MSDETVAHDCENCGRKCSTAYKRCLDCMCGTQESDVIDIIARQAGWKPLELHENMRVGSGGRKFCIQRVE